MGEDKTREQYKAQIKARAEKTGEIRQTIGDTKNDLRQKIELSKDKGKHV